MLGRLDPYQVLAPLRARLLTPPRATLLGVYSAATAAVLEMIVEQALAVGWSVKLWSLDVADSRLAQHTVGSGPGTRGENYNRLAVGVPDDHHLVLCDDDVAMLERGLVTWMTLTARLSLDISQPAHAPGSYTAHPMTRRTRRLLARRTTFVEMGPLVAFSPRIRRRVMPQQEDGYGWGTELGWLDLVADGARLGIVDAVPMWHLRPPAAGYSHAVEEARLAAQFRSRGISDWSEVQAVLQRVRWA